MEASSGFFSRIHPELDNILLGIMGSIGICCYIVILYFSSGSKATSTLHRLMHERRVIFIVLLLGILYYVDNVYITGERGWCDLSYCYFTTDIIRFDRHVFSSQTGIGDDDYCCPFTLLEYCRKYFSENRLQTIHAALGHIWGKYKLLHHQTIDIPNHSFAYGISHYCDICWSH